MTRERSCGPTAADAGGRRVLVAALLLALALVGCAKPDVRGVATTAPAAAPAKPPPKVLPLDEAILSAADSLFASARPAAVEGYGPGRRVVVIDPLIDGASGSQSVTTRSMEAQIVDLAHRKHPEYAFEAFSSAAVGKAPLVLLGSLTSVDASGEHAAATASRSYRIWLVLADLRSGTIVGRGVAHARVGDVDPTPLAHFRDSPAQAPDPSTRAYLRGCASPIGAPIDPTYLDGLLTAALVSDAISAYDDGRYEEALDLYRTASLSPDGDQLRVHNGIYLANAKLGRTDEAAASFERLVDFGLRQRQLAVKFLFRPGSSAFVADPAVSGAYGTWLERIARQAVRSSTCLELVGHTSPTGSALLNDRLSLLRARYVKMRLEGEAPGLAGRLAARGAGSRETIVGTGTDDMADALDRRVEFKVVDCPAAVAERAAAAVETDAQNALHLPLDGRI